MTVYEKSRWEATFQNIGVSIDQLADMSPEEFHKQCEFIRESGLECPDDPPATNNRKKPDRTSSGLIRDQQNEEYQRMQVEMQRNEAARKRIDEKKKEEAEKAKQNQEQTKNDKINAAKELGPEPADGIPICILMPSGKRIIRKFDKTHLCDELFTLVTGQEEMFDGYDSLPYQLMIINTPVEKGVTFQDAGITGKTMINVIEDDEDDDE